MVTGKDSVVRGVVFGGGILLMGFGADLCAVLVEEFWIFSGDFDVRFLVHGVVVVWSGRADFDIGEAELLCGFW